MKQLPSKLLFTPLKYFGRIVRSGLRVFSRFSVSAITEDPLKAGFLPVCLGTQMMPYVVVMKNQKTTRNFYDV